MGTGGQGDVAEDGSNFKIVPQYWPGSCIQWYETANTAVRPDATA